MGRMTRIVVSIHAWGGAAKVFKGEKRGLRPRLKEACRDKKYENWIWLWARWGTEGDAKTGSGGLSSSPMVNYLMFAHSTPLKQVVLCGEAWLTIIRPQQEGDQKELKKKQLG